MKSTGIVRTIDSVGRFVIPKDLRRSMGLESPNDKLEVFVDRDMIILRKFAPSCVFCSSSEKTVEYEGQRVCAECIRKLTAQIDDESQSAT